MAGYERARIWVRVGLFIVHLGLSVAAVLGAASFVLARGPYGAAPVTPLEVAANVVATALTSPLILLWRFGRGIDASLMIVVVVANSALWAWMLEWMWARTRARQ